MYHLEASEYCLIHYDNMLSEMKGVWVNPNVRVSYSKAADEVVNPQIGLWPSRARRLGGLDG